jgi:predicted Ser/Thr protein kinase
MAMNLAAETELTGDTGPMPVSPEEIASRLPLFDILEFLGRGGMGVVYKARQTALDREVAIKVLAGEWQKDVDFAERFEREAKTLAQMSHPNIVTVHDFGDADGLYYIVMEYVDGVNLRDLLSDGKMEPEQALAVVPPICDALEYAHGKGVVHRDIKPENLLLDREGRVKIADFGIASLVGKTKDISGTPSYMAPEQANGSVDRRTDIYALGVVLYEMLTGERPAKDIVAPSKKVEVDVKIDEMVLRALEKEPERRYQTAREFRTTAQMAMTPPHGDAANAGRSRSSCTSTHPAESPWPGRFFWLLASLVGTPAFALLAMLLAPQAARQGIGDFEVVSWLTGAAVLAVAALVPPAMLLNSLLRPRADSEQCDQTTGGSRGAYGAQAPPAAEGPTFSPWESTTALAGTIFSAAMLFPVMALPGPSRLPVMFLFLVAFSIGVVSLAGFWPFPSPFFPEPNFSSRNLPRYGARGDQRPNGEVATLACIAAVGLLLLTATGDALVMLVGASVMLLAGLAFCSRDGFRQSLLVGLAAIGVAAVVVLLALRGNILDVLPQSWGPEREVFLFELESESEGPRFLDLD